MKVIELQDKFGIDSLVAVDRPEPKPGPGQVLIKLRAWSLNYRDLMVVKGMYNPRLRFPMVPLSDGVGEVVELGAGVTRVKKGDRVASCFLQGWLSGQLTDEKAKIALGGGGPGMLTEYVVLPEDGVLVPPAHLSDEEAATLPCAGLTSWNALACTGSVKAGDVVLIQGTGGVSLFALQFANLLGARVIATSSNDEKLEKVRRVGASDGINYKNVPEWGVRARELTDGVGVDHIIEVGGAGTLGESLRAIRLEGHISLIGVLSGANQFNPIPVLMKHVRLQGIYTGSREMFESMNRAIALHQVKPVIDRVFDFREIGAALRYMESGKHFGKICLRAA
jgi:NADPH:quinone reductase-like Zn-dependent oxidoreductase